MLALGLDDGEYFELPYTFGEDDDADMAALQALRLFAGQVRYAQIISAPGETVQATGTLDDIITTAVVAALKASDWSQKDAADRLGMTAHQINYRIRLHKITPPPGHKNAWRANKSAR